ncbi:hypothetical protein CWI37_0299p0010 [Hamiltosporidium tvaerminnensis]|uniref:Uncharacterized protein n=2 Tax=Hamiltosporidium tvaerminnensis TaxID=1176355 RepID=A0A4Q9L3E3_9MICR|nr:hypothetical protein CWI37_0679p0010 [Hamiltosporidium tvaerminnensis]TBU03406.1 hypothetical protein CWI37_0299p0010 [Hamiltosporidium tvaerminnensis]
MLNSSANEEKCQLEKINKNTNNDTSEFLLEELLDYLFETYYIYIKSIIQIQSIEIDGSNDKASEIMSILSCNAHQKLVIFRKIASLNLALTYYYDFNKNHNKESLFSSVDDIPLAFFARETVLNELMLKICRKATEESKYNLIDIFNSFIVTNVKNMQSDYSKIKNLCQP